jgi:hypothetical protein
MEDDGHVTIRFERAALREVKMALHKHRLVKTSTSCDMAALDRAYEAVRAAEEGDHGGR